MIRSNTSDGADEKKQWGQSGELFTFWKLEAASNREPVLGLHYTVHVLTVSFTEHPR